MTNEAFSRVKIDAQLRDQGWAVENPNAIRYEYVLPDGTVSFPYSCPHFSLNMSRRQAARTTLAPLV